MGDPQLQPDDVYDLRDILQTTYVNTWLWHFNPPYHDHKLAKMCAQDLILKHWHYTSEPQQCTHCQRTVPGSGAVTAR